MDETIKSIFTTFFDEEAVNAQIIETSRGEDDFRQTVIIDTDRGNKLVLKLADNDFTFPGKVAVWQRTAEEYQRLGYYCPKIYADKSGCFPVVSYHGRKCTAYAEEYVAYRPMEDRFSDDFGHNKALYNRYKHDIWEMTAKVAQKHFDYTAYPSAYCLFETFCPSDKTDEVLENALNWKEYADTLPDIFKNQIARIWQLWTANRAELSKVYHKLPTSVFQADLNASNILIDDSGNFAGVYDFNLCGRDVFMNYLMRESDGVEGICDALKISAGYYRFSDTEKETALSLYRCLKPLWYSQVQELKEAGDDFNAVKAVLDNTENALVADYDFTAFMR